MPNGTSQVTVGPLKTSDSWNEHYHNCQNTLWDPASWSWMSILGWQQFSCYSNYFSIRFTNDDWLLAIVILDSICTAALNYNTITALQILIQLWTNDAMIMLLLIIAGYYRTLSLWVYYQYCWTLILQSNMVLVRFFGNIDLVQSLGHTWVWYGYRYSDFGYGTSSWMVQYLGYGTTWW
jgi:hypothetical protein